jgi:predicted PurR-regulated permease PerM
MGVLFGVLGLLLATPILVVLVILIKMFYIEDVLGDSVEVRQ